MSGTKNTKFLAVLVSVSDYPDDVIHSGGRGYLLVVIQDTVHWIRKEATSIKREIVQRRTLYYKLVASRTLILPYSGKFLRGKIYVDFVVGLTSVKIKSAIGIRSCVLVLHGKPASAQILIFGAICRNFVTHKFPAIRYIQQNESSSSYKINTVFSQQLL